MISDGSGGSVIERAAWHYLPPRDTLPDSLGSAVARLFGIELTDVDQGRVVLRMPLDEPVRGPAGTPWASALSVLADLGCALSLHTLLRGGQMVTSWDLAVEILAPAGPVAAAVRADGRVQWTDPGGGFVTAEIMDDLGRRIAVAQSRCRVSDLSPEVLLKLARRPNARRSGPDRQPEAGTTPPGAIASLACLTGVTCDGEDCLLAATAVMAGPIPRILGGALALPVECAIQAQAVGQPGTPSLNSLRLEFLSPVFVGRHRVRATVTRAVRTRRKTLYQCDLTVGERLVAMAQAVYAIGDAATGRGDVDAD